jgi:hypothetical protein
LKLAATFPQLASGQAQTVPISGSELLNWHRTADSFSILRAVTVTANTKRLLF